jgi:hypothetical protein
MTDALESGIQTVQSRHSDLPSLQSHSDVDGSCTTLMSQVISELAALSDPKRSPRLLRPIGTDIQMTSEEAVIASLLCENKTLGAIVDESPLDEEATFDFLARLVMHGILVIPQR